MSEMSSDQIFEFSDELVDPLGRKFQRKELDGDQSILIAVVSAENGTHLPRAHLMQHAEWTKRVGRRSAGFSVQ